MHFYSCRCEIADTPNSADSAIYLEITGSNKIKLMLAMTPGFHTQTFVAEILRLTENEEKHRSQHNFSWLEKYSKGMYIIVITTIISNLMQYYLQVHYETDKILILYLSCLCSHL